MLPLSGKSLRRGVSVMEVLISIGIVSVGLLGVVALVPVGGHQAQRGFMRDFASLYGKSAFRQFKLRGMGDSRNWVDFIPGGGGTVQTRDGTARLRSDAFCLDPRFLARENPVAQANLDAAAFPYRSVYTSGTNDPAAMRRITLRSNGAALTAAMADLIFQSGDDLRIDKPTDRSMPPVMWNAVGDPNASEPGPKPWVSFDDTAGLDNNSLISKRMSQGALSWMATIAPKVENNSSTTADNLYVLSVVVFEKRELAADGNMNGVTERVVRINATDFFGGGFGGGEVKLRGTAADLKNEFDDFGEGSWVMLMRKSSQGSMYRWYKVIAADEELGDSDTTRTVTLDGPDWSPDTSNTNPTYAVIVPGIIAVYEKVLRLEGSSLF